MTLLLVKTAVIALLLTFFLVPLLVGALAVIVDPRNPRTWAVVATIVAIMIGASWSVASAHDHMRADLNGWFGQLGSKGGGLCCSGDDGTAISDADWDTKDGHYRVRIENQWWDVPDDRVIKEPNRAGKTMVWPNITRGIDNAISKMEFRCFMPGVMT